MFFAWKECSCTDFKGCLVTRTKRKTSIVEALNYTKMLVKLSTQLLEHEGKLVGEVKWLEFILVEN